MKRDYRLQWLMLLLGACAFGVWSEYGRAWVRRKYFKSPPIAEAFRSESRFIAIMLPRIRPRSQKYAMSTAELTELLRALKASGHVSIGLDDVEALYRRGRRLPPKALLITFSENDPRGLLLADRALRKLRLRGAAFIRRTADIDSEDQRQYLTRHAVNQMRRGGGWDLGWISQETPPAAGAPGEGRALLDDDGRRPPPKRPELYPLRFRASEMGLNGVEDDPGELRVLALRPELGTEKNIRIVENSWPRTAAFSDDFDAEGPGADWIAGWGVVSMGHRRLALLPTPRLTSAGVFLRGTETWRDAAVEFVLKKYQREFWAYARYRENGGYVRVGARNGYWYVEQKISPKHQPSVLARAVIQEGGLPARVQLVLKGEAAMVYVNGRMMFGRALRLHPAVDRGRVFLGVYDGRSHSAMAVLTSVRAAALGDDWITTKRGGLAQFDEDRLEGLREAAVSARAMSPRWVTAGEDGRVSIAETQGVLVRSMAGFYACRLVPMADLTRLRPFVLAHPASADRLVDALLDAVRRLDAAGLNVRLRGGDDAKPEVLSFLTKLGGAIHARKQELWVTLEDGRTPGRALLLAVDGVLRPSPNDRPGIELLQASGRGQRETDQIQ